MGIAVWCEDEAGPFGTVPYPGESWQMQEHPAQYPHEYIRGGTAKLLTLFHPKDGKVRVKGVRNCTNQILHPWLKQQLAEIVQSLPPSTGAMSVEDTRLFWQRWRENLSIKFTLPQQLPALKLLLICDNLAGHKTPQFVVWLCEHGILPLYTPLGGSWLNMAESIQRILKRRALSGHHPQTPQQIIDWLEAVATAWNQHPTPFEWGGKRAARRQRARLRRHHQLGGSGACSATPIPRNPASKERLCS
jgi:DDE superfamily endonuclease